MAKRKSTATSKPSAATPRSRSKTVVTSPASTETQDGVAETEAGAAEQRVLAFAEQMGWVAGTIQKKTTGWMDRETLGKQLASVRDGAVSLLEYLETAAGLKKAEPPARTRRAGRSGGVVDAPGKKHRKPAPLDPRLSRTSSQAAAKVRTPDQMKKVSRPQARG
jgi:hypothetical protein